VKPLLLRGNLRAFAVSKPRVGTRYDRARQLWVGVDGTPVVLQRQTASDFGETTATTSQEGVDCTERFASDFGETTITKTAEGTDMTESYLSSDFGETTITRTAEGTDTTEAHLSSDFGETTKTATVEGTDQVEATDLRFDPDSRDLT
jgi:hypothetical protein